MDDRLLKNAMNTSRTPQGSCPDAETLAAWADGTLYGAAAEGLEAHLADCDRCQSILATFAATDPAPAVMANVPPAVIDADERERAPAVVPFTPRPSPMRWAVPLAIGTLAASLIMWVAWPRPNQVATLSPDTSIARGSVESTPAPKQADLAKQTPPTTPPAAPNAATETVARAAKPDPAPKASPTSRAAGTLAETKPSPAPLPPPPPATYVPPPAPPPPAALPVVVASPTPTPSPLVVAGGAAAGSAVGMGSAASSTATADLMRIGTGSAQPAGLGQTAAQQRALSYLMVVPGVGVEFGPDPVASVSLTATDPGRAGGRGGGAAGGGGGRGGAGGGAASQPPRLIRWRVLLSGLIEKTIDGGRNWSRIAIDPAVAITTGAAPSAAVCWLAGKSGAVMKSTDGGATFARVTVPETADLQAITATDDKNATVTTADGRHLSTTDGGQTWHRD